MSLWLCMQPPGLHLQATCKPLFGLWSKSVNGVAVFASVILFAYPDGCYGNIL